MRPNTPKANKASTCVKILQQHHIAFSRLARGLKQYTGLRFLLFVCMSSEVNRGLHSFVHVSSWNVIQTHTKSEPSPHCSAWCSSTPSPLSSSKFPPARALRVVGDFTGVTGNTTILIIDFHKYDRHSVEQRRR